MVSGRRADADGHQQSEDEGRPPLPAVEGSSLQFREPNTKGGKEKAGVVDYKKKSGSGVQGTLDPVQISSVVQGLQAVAKENKAHSWAEEVGSGEEKTNALNRQDISAIMSKGKAKGKSLQSSK